MTPRAAEIIKTVVVWLLAAALIIVLTSGAAWAAAPTVEATSTSDTSPSSTNHVVTLPSGIVSGSLVICGIALDLSPGTDQTLTSPAGWTEFFNLADPTLRVRAALVWRRADGTEGSTITFTSEGSRGAGHACVRIEGHHASTDPEAATPTTGNDSNPDPPALDPSFEGDILWLVWAFFDGVGDTVTAFPSNYSGGIQANDAASVGTARRALTATSENPGTFTLSSSEEWIGATVGVPPAGVPPAGLGCRGGLLLRGIGC